MFCRYSNLKLSGTYAVAFSRKSCGKSKSISIEAMEEGRSRQLSEGSTSMSVTSKTKAKRYLQGYVLTLEHLREEQRAKKRKLPEYPTFATLTYCAPVKHTELECKRQHLNHFLIKMEREQNISNWLWRVERQANGNLHYHLILPNYICHKYLRKTWNDIIEGDGYVSDFEAKHKHRNPNSTDIRKIDNMRTAINYISKYITKWAETDEGLKNQPIIGRLWGCSDNLKLFKPYSISDEELTEHYQNDLGYTNVNILLSQFESNGALKALELEAEGVKIYAIEGNERSMLGSVSKTLPKLYDRFYISQRQFL